MNETTRVTAELQAVFNQAREAGDAATMVEASMAKAKLYGLIVEHPSPEAAQAARHRAATRELGRRLRKRAA